MKKIRYFIFLWMVLGIIFSGCVKTSKNPTTKSTESPIPAYETLFVYKDGYIQKIRADDGMVVDFHELTNDLRPLTFKVNETFKVNVAQNYVVWFVPTKGIVRFRLVDKNVDTIYKPSDWFLENPFFQFYGETNTLVLIDSKGSEMKWIDLDTGAIETRPVPFPFGTVFAISPDTQKIFFVEGYRQSKIAPVYLITDIKGELITKFSTNSEIANRSMMTWANDSKSLVAVENNNQIISYSLEAIDTPSVVYEVPKGEKIVALDSRNDLLLIRTELYLYLFDQNLRSVIRKLPVDSMKPLNNPRALLVDRDYFYIEEEVKSFESYHKRLWHGDWAGGKTIIIPDYGHHVVQVESL